MQELLRAEGRITRGRGPVEDGQLMEHSGGELARLRALVGKLRDAAAADAAAAAGAPLPSPAGAGAASSAQQQLTEAERRLVRLERWVAGPVMPADATVSDPALLSTLMDALAVVEFLTTFPAITGVPEYSLVQLQHAVAWPAETPALQELYLALVRFLVLMLIQEHGPAYLKAKRWGRVVNGATWPEVLRRYLLLSRANQAVTESQLDCTEWWSMEDDVLAVKAALMLARTPPQALPPAFHLRLLHMLCNDMSGMDQTITRTAQCVKILSHTSV